MAAPTLLSVVFSMAPSEPAADVVMIASPILAS